MNSILRFTIGLALLVIFLPACGGGDGGNTPSDRQLHSFSQGSAGFYYNPPTLVGNYVYIGTSRGIGYDVANDNYFFKLNLNLTKAWEYHLGNTY